MDLTIFEMTASVFVRNFFAKKLRSFECIPKEFYVNRTYSLGIDYWCRDVGYLVQWSNGAAVAAHTNRGFSSHALRNRPALHEDRM